MQTETSSLKIYKNFHDNFNFNIIKIINEDETSESPFLVKEPSIIVYGNIVKQRRNVGFFSNESLGYFYSKKLMKSQPLTDEMLMILEKVNIFLKTNFNGILINNYINGSSCIGAHSDDEKTLSNNKVAIIWR